MITVLRNYGSAATDFQRIEPGDYAEDDARLYGLADYLLENGHAVKVGAVAVAAPVVEPEPAPEPQPESVEPDVTPEAEPAPVPTPRKRKGG